MTPPPVRIAVVGAGVAGLTAAYLLQRSHDVTLFERNHYLGGHTHTVVLPDGPDAGTPVDTGFIVLNNRNYPLLHKLLRHLECPVRWSDMSFAFCCRTSGLSYAGTNLNGLFAQRRNVVSPSFWRLLTGILRFCREARAALAADTLSGLTLGDFVRRIGVHEDVVRDYVVPMGAAIWSATQQHMLEFPALTLIRFWENHGLLSTENRPRWQTIQGGSHAYVKVIRQRLQGRMELKARIRCVRREADAAILQFEDGTQERFDQVVLATHADEALKLLADPSPEEMRLLEPWTYQDNHTVLHTDCSVMPPLRRSWASWNYVRDAGLADDQPVPVTYDMNRLQGLKTSRNYFVTLNPLRPVPPEHVIKAIDYRHPVFSAAAVATQKDLPGLIGHRRTSYCGSYFGYGFHEDAVRSGLAVAKHFHEEL